MIAIVALVSRSVRGQCRSASDTPKSPGVQPGLVTS